MRQCSSKWSQNERKKLLEAEAIQDPQDRIFLVIQYLYFMMKLDQKRESWLISVCEAKAGEPSRNSSASVRIFVACIFFSISSRKLDIVKELHKTRIWDKLEVNSGRKRSPRPRRNYMSGITRQIKRIALIVPRNSLF